MQLLDTYLKSVARFLPAAERDDIVRELSENLRSQIEDREAQINRPLTDAEVKALLDRFGSPLEVAGRYRQDNRVLAFGWVLVGPVLFPFYAKVLGFVLGITAAAMVIIGAALRRPAGSLVQGFLTQLFIQFAIITVIFSLAEIGLSRRPSALGAPRPMPPATPPRAGDKPRVARLESLSQIIALAVLLAWLPALRNFALDAIAGAGLAPAPVWGLAYTALAVIWCAGIVQALVNLLRPNWLRFRSAVRLALDIVSLGAVAIILGAGRWVAPLDPSAPSAVALGKVVEAVNQGLFVSLVVTAIIVAITTFFDARRLIRAA
jgi:HAAS